MCRFLNRISQCGHLCGFCWTVITFMFLTQHQFNWIQISNCWLASINGLTRTNTTETSFSCKSQWCDFEFALWWIELEWSPLCFVFRSKNINNNGLYYAYANVIRNEDPEFLLNIDSDIFWHIFPYSIFLWYSKIRIHYCYCWIWALKEMMMTDGGAHIFFTVKLICLSETKWLYDMITISVASKWYVDQEKGIEHYFND